MSRPYFCKLVLLSTVQDKRLGIPESFATRFGHELASVATLILPNGHVWQVGLRRFDNKLWFLDGWQELMNHFAIHIGFFLVFRYQGKSTFSINIFNLPSSEINYQIENMGNVGEPKGKACHLFEEMDDEEAVEIEGFVHPFSTPESKFSQSSDKLSLSQGYSARTTQNLFSGSDFHNSVNRDSKQNQISMRSTKDIGVQVSAHELENPVKRLNSFSPGSELGSVKPMRKRRRYDPEKQGSSTLQDEEGEARIRFYESASVRKRTVTAEERERTLNAAKMFEPTNPFCRVVLRPSYLYRGCIMHLPSCFAEKHLNGVCGFIKLQNSDGKQWPVRCLYRCLYKGGRAKLSQGWYEFSLENNLEEGDVCVFEMLNAKEVILQVTIFRVETNGQVHQSLEQNINQTKATKK